MEEPKVLKLTLKRKPFAVMLTGEKDFEVRKPSKWILSRLKNKKYDNVQFVNGYGNSRPMFFCEYKGWFEAIGSATFKFSDGLAVNVEKGDIIIQLGEVHHHLNCEGFSKTRKGALTNEHD